MVWIHYNDVVKYQYIEKSSANIEISQSFYIKMLTIIMIYPKNGAKACNWDETRHNSTKLLIAYTVLKTYMT